MDKIVNLSQKLGSYNVRGFKSREPVVRRLMQEEDLDILMLQETLLQDIDRFYSEHSTELLNRSRADGATRGSAMLIKRSIKYKLILKELTESYELIADRSGTLTICGIYIRIDHNAARMVQFLMEKV